LNIVYEIQYGQSGKAIEWTLEAKSYMLKVVGWRSEVGG